VESVTGFPEMLDGMSTLLLILSDRDIEAIQRELNELLWGLQDV
jgi:hypothetical protein